MIQLLDFNENNCSEISLKDLRESGYTIPGWYFWDEASFYCYGPFDTQEEAKKTELDYASKL